MAQNMRNSLLNFLNEGCFAAGVVSVSGTTPSLGSLTSNSIDQACLSVVRDSQGVFTISVTNFRGQNGSINAVGNGTTTSTIVAVTALAYTSDTNTANFTFSVEDDGSTLSDTGFTFILLAY